MGVRSCGNHGVSGRQRPDAHPANAALHRFGRDITINRHTLWRKGLLWSGVAILAVVGAMLAFKPGPAVADGPVGGVPVAPPPTPLPSVIVYQPVSDLPEWVPSDDEALATTEAEFQSLLQQYADLPGFRGTIIVTDDPNTTETWPPVDTGVTHLRIRFRDVAYYNNVWVPQIGDDWIPGFLDRVEVDPAPTPGEGLYDMDVWQVTDESTATIVTLRVAVADGAIGVVSTEVVAYESQPLGERAGCSAGDWWQFGRTCCRSQRFLCHANVWIVACAFHDHPLACAFTCFVMDCDDCYQDCMNCQPSNPCHSCDPCGLSWILCHAFGDC